MIFFFNDTATTEIYTLSLHDALPICYCCLNDTACCTNCRTGRPLNLAGLKTLFMIASRVGSPNAGWLVFMILDRKSTRLNSSHANISYAVFCLKKKKKLHHRAHSDIN